MPIPWYMALSLPVAGAAQVSQAWCWAEFEWPAGSHAGPVLRFHRSLELDCSGYDQLLISIKAPGTAGMRLTARTDVGDRILEASLERREHALALDGAVRITAIEVLVEAGDMEPGAGWINWLGLQDSGAMDAHLRQSQAFDARWDQWLQPASDKLCFQPHIGIVMDAEGLEELRRQHEAAGPDSPFLRVRDSAAGWHPEANIHQYVAQVCASRYAREREEGQQILGPGRQAALAGLVLKDAELLRLAARYALSLAVIPVWDSGFVCAFPTGVFEHRSFSQASCTEEVAFILDLAGEVFTGAGRDLAKRRVAESGIGQINYVTWAHEYIHHCNQLAAFSGGCILGYALLERDMPCVKPYTELAYADLVQSLEEVVLEDGGFVEGPSYLLYTVVQGGRGLYYYARARGTDLVDSMPAGLKRTGAFAAAVGSTDEGAEMIPICDASPGAGPEPPARTSAPRRRTYSSCSWTPSTAPDMSMGTGRRNTFSRYTSRTGSPGSCWMPSSKPG